MHLYHFTYRYALATASVLMLAIQVFPEARAQDQSVQLRIISFPLTNDSGDLELLIGPGKTMPVSLPTRDLSSAYKVPALATWTIGKSTFNKDGTPTFESYGKAASIDTHEQILLVLKKGSTNADGLEIIPLAGGKSSFDGGTYFLYNATSVDIAGSIGNQEFSLKPKSHSLIAPEPTRTKGSRQYVFAKMYYRHEKKIQPFFTSTWRFNHQARSMVFFYHDPSTRHLRLHTIRNYMP